MQNPPDVYDYRIHMFHKQPEMLAKAVENGDAPGGRMFRMCAPSGKRQFWEGGLRDVETGKWEKDPPLTGDIILVHRRTDSLGRPRVAHTKKLTDAIWADDRIPLRHEDVTLDHLELFAEWARKMDEAFGEPTPPAPKEFLDAVQLGTLV